tara:strand:+ start:13 stop:645 length:633 start_codon:yes stop_codon:yes gene_type:complete
MLERNIKLYEPIELIVFLVFSGLYYLGVSEKYNFFERFDYDINVFIVISIICLILGLKKYTADGRGISKTFFFLPIYKKTKTWSEIKHMAHVTAHKKDKYDRIICSNFILFIDFNDRICFKMKDKTRKSKYDKKTKSIVTKKLKQSLNYGGFMKLVKSREETFETDLVMNTVDLAVGYKVNYNQTSYPYKEEKSLSDYYKLMKEKFKDQI